MIVNCYRSSEGDVIVSNNPKTTSADFVEIRSSSGLQLRYQSHEGQDFDQSGT